MRIFRFKEIDSTNVFLKNLKEKKDYDVAVAETQTLGRGRRGNKWSSEKGGAYFSFLLEEKKDISMETYSLLPLVAGYSLMKTFKKTEPHLNFMFKWTNDIYINNKKISGILVEKIDNFFVIGIGINLNNEIKGEAENRGISMGELTQKEYNINEIIISIIENFKRDLAYYLSGNWEEMLSYLNSKNYLYGKDIDIHFGNGEISRGKAKKIHKSGKLVVEIKGKAQLFNVGEIHISKNN